jgi:hypothetical protein
MKKMYELRLPPDAHFHEYGTQMRARCVVRNTESIRRVDERTSAAEHGSQHCFHSSQLKYVPDRLRMKGDFVFAMTHEQCDCGTASASYEWRRGDGLRDNAEIAPSGRPFDPKSLSGHGHRVAGRAQRAD